MNGFAREVVLSVFESPLEGPSARPSGDWLTVQAIVANWPNAPEPPPPTKGHIIASATRQQLVQACKALGIGDIKTLAGYHQYGADKHFKRITLVMEQCLAPSIRTFLNQTLPDRVTVLSDLDDDFAIPWELLSLPSMLYEEASLGAFSEITTRDPFVLERELSPPIWGERFAFYRQVIRASRVGSSPPQAAHRLPAPNSQDFRALLILCPSKDLREWDQRRRARFGATVQDDLMRIFEHAGLSVQSRNVHVLQYEKATQYAIMDELKGVGELHGGYDLIYYYGHVKDGGLCLSDSDTPVHPQALGVSEGNWIPAPLVIINGCSSLGSTLGWGPRYYFRAMPMAFLSSGTPHFIGTYWDVHPETAHRMGAHLLQHLLLDLDTLAEALTKARRDVKLWITRNRKTAKLGRQLPTCPDWSAYTLSSTCSSHKPLLYSPEVRFHYGQPSLHQLYFVKATPGGYVRHLEPHPLTGESLARLEDGEDEKREKRVHIVADTISSFASQKSILEEQEFVILGSIFAALPGDDGILVSEEAATSGEEAPDSALLLTLSDIKKCEHPFVVAALSENFYLNEWCEAMLEQHGLRGKIRFKYIPYLASYPYLLANKLIDGAWMFGALFHAAMVQRSGPVKAPLGHRAGVRLLEGSSVVEFYRQKLGEFPIPVALAARKSDVKRYPMLFRNLLYRIRQSMYTFLRDDSKDSQIASEMGIDSRALQRLRKSQCPTDVYFSLNQPLPQAFKDIGLEPFVYRDLPSLEPASVLPTDVVKRDHDWELCVCARCRRPEETLPEVPPDCFVIDRKWIVEHFAAFCAEIEQWPLACLGLVQAKSILDEGRALKQQDLRYVVSILFQNLPRGSLVYWTGEDPGRLGAAPEWLQPRTLIAVIPLAVQPEIERILGRIDLEVQSKLPLKLEYIVIEYTTTEESPTAHYLKRAFHQLGSIDSTEAMTPILPSLSSTSIEEQRRSLRGKVEKALKGLEADLLVEGWARRKTELTGELESHDTSPDQIQTSIMKEWTARKDVWTRWREEGQQLLNRIDIATSAELLDLERCVADFLKRAQDPLSKVVEQADY